MMYKVHGPELTTDPVISWRSRMEGKTYRFKLSYRDRHDCWDLQIATSAGEVVIDGIRVSEGFDLLYSWTDSRLPPGKLVCVDTQGKGAHPTRNDWRERHYLRYETAEDVEEVDNELSVVPSEPEEMPE